MKTEMQIVESQWDRVYCLIMWKLSIFGIYIVGFVNTHAYDYSSSSSSLP